MTASRIKRGDIWWVSLDPTQGSKIKKTQPCVVLTHDTLNRLRRTIVVVPLSTAA
ncbi:MAG: type II toxin-antitoxin system PemK/MazF family toxin [Deltaproteobacteria bacterium]|nr:type II toxin-antitoxin system PemK/MazF family toxin [Deltaproteobacteria bacterium]